jgi:hypothetical protein
MDAVSACFLDYKLDETLGVDILTPKLTLLVYREKYQELISSVEETTKKDFQGILSRVELCTVKELLSSYRHHMMSRSKESYQRFLEGAPWS